ncbi:hypothetical protein Q5530_35415 [Saccharothrix sp. BKS2]|uniref:hypothetical protein n=1 Tax=Saccharothrix sp. BKS2 TaxID=3064400 RepID=UPI0039EA97B8
MNTTLPPERDVPPHRHAEIRAGLERAVAHRRARYAPLLTAGIAAAAVAVLVVVLAPGQRPTDDAGAATSPVTINPATTNPVTTNPVTTNPATTAPATTTGPTTKPPSASPGLTPARVDEIEQGCAAAAPHREPAVLHQYHVDPVGGDLAVLYTEHGVVECTVDGPTAAYHPSSTAVRDREWLPGPFAADAVVVSSGGDLGKARHGGTRGRIVAVGRVSAPVARVVHERLGRSAEASIANRTFVARLDHPSDLPAPGDGEPGTLTAYDAGGGVLARITGADLTDPTRCWVRPDGLVVAGRSDADPAGCLPATPWR